MNWYKQSQVNDELDDLQESPAEEEFENSVVLRAYDGDRATNLDSIADWILENYSDRNQHNQLWGYAQQMKIIADEMRAIDLRESV